jgi:hypothetical protein
MLQHAGGESLVGYGTTPYAKRVESRVAADNLTWLLDDLEARYEERPASPTFSRIYEEVDRWGHMFAVLHEELNGHFDAINGRAASTRHYWADNSRGFLQLIKDLKGDLYALKRGGVDAQLVESYQRAIERCQPWLSPSGGSTVPDDFEPVEIIQYDQIFNQTALSVTLKKDWSRPNSR